MREEEEGIPPGAFAELSALYADLDAAVAAAGLSCRACGACCDFPTAGHRLYASRLERAWFAAAGPPPGPAPEGLCPWWHEHRCLNRAHRVLGCRAHFCADTEAASRLYEEFHARIKALHARFVVAYDYARMC